MDFKSFQNTEPYSDYRYTAAGGNGNSIPPQQTPQNIKDAVDSLSKLSDSELMNELSKQVAVKKKNGTAGDIDKLLKTIQPFLNSEQKQRLEIIMKNMKG